MNEITIRNKYNIDVTIAEGKHYYVEVETDRSDYTSGIICVQKITAGRIVFEPITAKVPDYGLSYQGVPACDVGSLYAKWILSEELPPQSEIAISFDSLMI